MDADNELLLTTQEPARGWRFCWVLPILFRPRATMRRIVENAHPTSRTPLTLVVLVAVIHALVAGSIRAAAAAAGEVSLPQGFEFYTPEQQAQFMQAATATNNATFNYVLPAAGAALGVIVLWLLIGGLLHLVLTLFGGRGTSRSALNVAAWSFIPLLLRYVIQIVAMLMTDSLVASPGLAGFAPAGEGFFNAFLAGILSHVDIFLLWQIVLLWIGVHLSSRLPLLKSLLAVLATMLIVLALRALPAAVLAQFGGLTIIQPFI